MDNRTTSLCLTYKWPCNPLLRILTSIPSSCHSLLLCFKIRLEGLWGRDHAFSYIPRKSLFFTALKMYLLCISLFEFLFWNVKSSSYPHSHSFHNPKWDSRKKVVCCSFHSILTKMPSTGFFLFSELPNNACLSFFFHTILLTVVNVGVVPAILVIFSLCLTNPKFYLFLCTENIAVKVSPVRQLLHCIRLRINNFLCCCSFVWNIKAVTPSPLKKLVCWEKKWILFFFLWRQDEENG